MASGVRASTSVDFHWNTAALDALLKGPSGPTAKMLDAKGALVESQAKRNASGRPGPNVVTGRGRSSITHRMGSDGQGLYCDIGSGAFYMGILEKQGHYTWLRPALSAIR